MAMATQVNQLTTDNGGDGSRSEGNSQAGKEAPPTLHVDGPDSKDRALHGEKSSSTSRGTACRSGVLHNATSSNHVCGEEEDSNSS